MVLKTILKAVGYGHLFFIHIFQYYSFTECGHVQFLLTDLSVAFSLFEILYGLNVA